MSTFNKYGESLTLIETVKKIDGRWAFVSRKSGKVLTYYDGEGEPSDDWVRKQERSIQYFSEVNLDKTSTIPKTLAPHVFCDMDGVIADFYAGIKQYFNVSSSNLNAFLREEGVWKIIGKKEPRLFAKLPELPDARQLMTGLETLRKRKLIRLSILTAIPTEWYADPVLRRVGTVDKIAWVTRRFPQIPAANVLVVRRKDKANYAKAQVAADQPRSILIDDFSKNIREWDAAGGIGIQHTNSGVSLRALLHIIR